MIFTVLLNILASLAFLLVWGSGFYSLFFGTGYRQTIHSWLERLLLGAYSLGLLSSVMLLTPLSNHGLSYALWIATVLLIFRLVSGAKERSCSTLDRIFSPGLSRDEWVIAGIWLLFVATSFCFIALPDLRELNNVDCHAIRSGGLPADCWLPFRVSEMAYGRLNPEVVTFFGDWRLSDRGPLSGLVFFSMRLLLGVANYQDFVAVGTMLNGLFVLASMALLYRITNNVRAPVWFAILSATNTFLFLNTWFTWPKLLAIACLICALQAALERRPAIWVGALAAIGGLSHGVAELYLPGLALLIYWFNRRPAWRIALVAMSYGLMGYILIQMPWRLYTTYWHPDVHRLIKWHIFNHPEPTSDSVWSVALEYWRTQSFKTILTTRWSNLTYPFNLREFQSAWQALLSGNWQEFRRKLHVFSFYYFLGGINLFFLTACVLGYRRLQGFAEWVRALLFWGGSALLFAIAAYGIPENTDNHQWAYGAIVGVTMIYALCFSRSRLTWSMGALITLGIANEFVVQYDLLQGRSKFHLDAELITFLLLWATLLWVFLRINRGASNSRAPKGLESPPG